MAVLLSYSLKRASRGLASAFPKLQYSYSSPAGDYEVAIGGGGIMGLTSAYFLAQRLPASAICVIERDPDVSLVVIHNLDTATKPNQQNTSRFATHALFIW